MGTVTKFGRMANTTLLSVNGASPAGLGLGGQGFLSYSIATPTGEGITTPLTFTRFRRVMVAGSLRVILRMQLETLIGHQTSTIKHPSLVGWNLAVVHPVRASGDP